MLPKKLNSAKIRLREPDSPLCVQAPGLPKMINVIPTYLNKAINMHYNLDI